MILFVVEGLFFRRAPILCKPLGHVWIAVWQCSVLMHQCVQKWWMLRIGENVECDSEESDEAYG